MTDADLQPSFNTAESQSAQNLNLFLLDANHNLFKFISVWHILKVHFLFPYMGVIFIWTSLQVARQPVPSADLDYTLANKVAVHRFTLLTIQFGQNVSLTLAMNIGNKFITESWQGQPPAMVTSANLEVTATLVSGSMLVIAKLVLRVMGLKKP